VVNIALVTEFVATYSPHLFDIRERKKCGRSALVCGIALRRGCETRARNSESARRALYDVREINSQREFSLDALAEDTKESAEVFKHFTFS
jgi:hypothetical protein